MNDEKAKNILQTFGANAQRWPDDVKDDMASWVNAQSAENQVLAQEKNLDSKLDSYQVSGPSAHLVQSILDKITLSDQITLRRFFQPVIPKTSFLMLTLILGIIIGLYNPLTQNAVLESDISTTAFAFDLDDNESIL